MSCKHLIGRIASRFTSFSPELLARAALVIITVSGGPALVRADWPANHLDLARYYVTNISPENNTYGSPSFLGTVNGVLVANTQCNSFVYNLLKQGYPTVTPKVLEALTTSKTPTAALYHDAIVANSTAIVTGVGTFTFGHISQISDILPGDILAAKYTTPTATGHVMLVNDLVEVTPFVWIVNVLDSTHSIHGDYPGSTDSRYATNKEGIGSAMIVLIEGLNGEIAGWCWNTKQKTPYSATDPAATHYRPIAAGRLAGPGI